MIERKIISRENDLMIHSKWHQIIFSFNIFITCDFTLTLMTFLGGYFERTICSDCL